MLFRKGVINLDVEQIRSGARNGVVDYIAGEAAVCGRQERKHIGHYFARREVWIIRQDVAGDGRVRGGIVKLVCDVVIQSRSLQMPLRKPRLAKCREVAVAKIFIGEVVETGATIFEPESLIGEEKEGFIFSIVDFGDPDWTSKGGAEIILRIHASLCSR